MKHARHQNTGDFIAEDGVEFPFGLKHLEVGHARERLQIGCFDAWLLGSACKEHLTPDPWPLLQRGGQPFAVEQGNSVAGDQKATSAGGELAKLFEGIAQIMGRQEFFHRFQGSRAHGIRAGTCKVCPTRIS